MCMQWYHYLRCDFFNRYLNTIWRCDFNSINIQKVKNPLMWFLLLEQYRLMSHSKLWTLCVFVCAGLYMYRSYLCIWIYACVHLYSVRVQLMWIGDEFLFRLVLELRCHVCDCDYLSLYPCVTPSGSLDHQCRRWNACATLVDVKSKFNKPVCIMCRWFHCWPLSLHHPILCRPCNFPIMNITLKCICCVSLMSLRLSWSSP